MSSAAIFIVSVFRYGRKTNFMQHMELFRFSTKPIFVTTRPSFIKVSTDNCEQALHGLSA